MNKTLHLPVKRNANRTSQESGGTDSSNGIETGVIIMGLSCVCVVACALLLLQIRSASLQRRRRRRQQSRAQVAIVSAPARSLPDPLEVSGPPAYDTVMRNPQLYPLSPRSSISSTRRLSTASGLSTLGTRLLSSTQASPDSEELSHSTSAQDFSLLVQKDSDDEDPPPYPGNAGCHSNEGVPKANVHSVNAWINMSPRRSPRNSIQSNSSYGNLGYESGCYDERRNSSKGRNSVSSNHSNMNGSRRSSAQSSSDHRSSSVHSSGCRGNKQRSVSPGSRNSESTNHGCRSRGNSVCVLYTPSQELTVDYFDRGHASTSSASSNRTRRVSSDERCHENGLLGSELFARDQRRSHSFSSGSGSAFLQPHSAWDESFPRELAFLPSTSSGAERSRRRSSESCRCHCHNR